MNVAKKLALLIAGAIVGAKYYKYQKNKKYIEELKDFIEKSKASYTPRIQLLEKKLRSSSKDL